MNFMKKSGGWGEMRVQKPKEDGVFLSTRAEYLGMVRRPQRSWRQQRQYFPRRSQVSASRHYAAL
jgi:hypothetical protein